MKIGRNKRTAAAVLGLMTAGLLWMGPAHAQDSGSLLKDAVELSRRGKAAEANKKARAALAANPSSEEAYEIVQSTDAQIFLEMLKAGGDMEKVAAHFLRLSHREQVERSQDEGAIRTLVNRAVAPGDSNLPDRMEAARELAAAHGEYAVPALVAYLGTNDTHQRANAIMALRRIGSDAIAPLAASLQTGNEMQRNNVAGLLSAMGDHRSAPAVARHKGDKAAAAGYVKLAKNYFGGDPQTLRNYDGTYAVWRAEDGKLVKHDVPRFLYHFELAEQACYDALSVDPKSSEARALIALVSFAEIVAHSNLSEEAQAAESIKGAGAALSRARGLAASVGAGDLLQAMSMGVKMGANAAAAHIAGALPSVWDGRKLDAGNALVEGLQSSEKSVRYASAIALATISPSKAFPKSKMVGRILGDAAGEVGIHQVLVIDSNSKNAMNVQRKLNGSGMHAVAATSGASGLIMAKNAAAFDVIVVASSLSKLTAFHVIDELARDFRTSSAKVVVMAPDGKVGDAKADFEKRNVAGYAPTSADLVGVAKAVAAAAAGAGDWPAQRANAQSIAASNAIAGSSSSALNLSAAEAGLANAVREGADDAVRLAGLNALASVATSASEGVLAGVVGKTENSPAIRAAAASALGSATRGKAPADGTYKALLAAMGDADVGVNSAAGAALGSAKLTDAQRTAVMQARRVD